MKIIKRGNTCDYIAKFDESIDVQNVQNAVISYKSGEIVREIPFNKLTVNTTDNSISYCFSQEETLELEVGKMQIELNALIDDKRPLYCIVEVLVVNTLHPEVIE